MVKYIVAAACLTLGGLLGTVAAFVPRRPVRPVRTFAAVCFLAVCGYVPILYCFAKISRLPFSAGVLFPDGLSLLVGGWLFLLTALAMGLLLGFFRAGGPKVYWNRAVGSTWHKGLLAVITAVNLAVALAGVGFHDAILTRSTTLRITEVCPHNFNLLALNGDPADYIELYNYGTRPVQLRGFSLSDSEQTPAKCALPELEVQPGEYVLVWADGSEPRVVGENQITVSFRLSDGEQVCLSVGGKLVIETVDIPELEDNVTLTLLDDGSWIAASGTPGQPNSGAVPYVSDTPDAPGFSTPGGFYADPVTVELTAGEGCQIFYTLDGSTPTDTSLPYLGPIAIEETGIQPNRFINEPRVTIGGKVDPMYEEPVDKGTVLRAVAVDASGSRSRVSSACYFVGDFSAYEGKSVLSIVCDPDDLIGPEGICVTGTEYDAWAQSGGAEEDEPTPNFQQHGKLWERPAAVQLWDADGQELLNDPCGIRLQGNASRVYRLKRFSLFAREFYGGGDTFSAPIFGDWKTHSFFLRRDNYDFMAQMLLDGRDLGYLRAVPVSVFLDGEFYYTAYLRERYDGAYFAAHYGVDPKDVIHLSDSEVHIGRFGEEKLFQELVDYIGSHDASDPEVYEEVERQMDVQSYIDFVAANLYCNNMDWSFIKNFQLWRTRSEDGEGYEDGRWRWLAYDMDAIAWSGDLPGESGPAMDTFHCTQPYVRGGYPRPAYIDMPIFSDLLQNEAFKTQFALTYLDMMNVNFRYEQVLPLLRQYGLESNSYLTDFFERRPGYAVKYLADALELPGEPCTLTVNVQSPEGGSVKVNTAVPDTGSGAWEGTYLTGLSVTLFAEPKPGWEFAGWQENGSESPELSLALKGDTSVTAVFVRKQTDRGEAYAD